MSPRVGRPALIAVVCALQAVLVLVAVYPRLSARVLGEEYRLAVAPVDPIDPFRGAYVTLSYPDLPEGDGRLADPVFIPLAQHGNLWRGVRVSDERPSTEPYLACRESGSGLQCGIESLFASQGRARRLESLLQGGGAVAVVRIDGRGNAAVVSLEPEADEGGSSQSQ